MKNCVIITSLLTLIMYGCCTTDFCQFNEKASSIVKNNKHIDKKSYESLVELAKISDEKAFQQFKNEDGKIDNSKITAYLLKYLSAKKITLTNADIWQPEETKADKFNINVYLENSASMDGYVKGVTEFETAIYNLLGDFKISGICDSLNLSYINKSIPYQKKNALAPDIQDFIEKLEPSTFRQRGGDRSTSDLKNILSTVLKNIDEKNAAVLISDFVFSPGSNINAQDYLNNQGVGIKIDFAEKLKVFDLSAVLVQLQSNFDGLYYDKTDKPISLNCQRPYYIWIIGSKNQIKEIIKSKIIENVKGGYLNRLVLQANKSEVDQPSFKILPRKSIGDFSLKSIENFVITDAVASNDNNNKGMFEFTIAIDFFKSLEDENFFADSNNYQSNDKTYSLNPEIIIDKNNPTLNGYSHILKLKTNKLIDESLKIDVIGKTPSWVYSSTSVDDSGIAKDNLEKQKTFGFKYLVEGVCEAFYPKSKSNVISTIVITINK